MPSSWALRVSVPLFSAFVLSVHLFQLGDLKQPQSYRAAVFEHVRRSTIEENLKLFESAVAMASFNTCDIIVFPEYGILPPNELNRAALKSLFPDLGAARIGKDFCNNGTQSSDVIHKLSCLAKHHQIVLVANYGSFESCAPTEEECPPDGFFLFNTNFAFNSDGKLLGIYRKYHLFDESRFNSPPKFDVSIFTTEFATFTMMICFDIIFGEIVDVVKSNGIENVIFPTFWVDSYPLYLSVDVQASWAIGYNVNLLAANIQNPTELAAGSGIYSGSMGALKYIYEDSWKSRLIVSDVPSSPGRPSNTGLHKQAKEPSHAVDHVMRNKGLKNANLTLIKVEGKSAIISATNEGLYCNLNYSHTIGLMTKKYYFGAYNGSISSQNESWWIEVCMLFAEIDQSSPVNNEVGDGYFRWVTLDGNFSSEDVLPKIMLTNYTLPNMVNWNIESHKIESKASNDKIHLLYIALYGRSFKNDKP